MGLSRSAAVIAVAFSVSAAACKQRTGSAPSKVKDTGWYGDTSAEIEGLLVSELTVKAAGDNAAVATDKALQEKLVDMQVKFLKTRMTKAGYHANQLFDKVTVTKVTPVGDKVTIAYEAVVDMLRDTEDQQVPTLESLSPRVFTDVALPVDPVDVLTQGGDACAEPEDSSLREENYYYYFAPKKTGCAMALHQATLTLTKVLPRPAKVYPEYEDLLGPLPGQKKGFKAAIVPDEGDSDPLSRFNVHKEMLEKELQLTGEKSADETYTQYVYTKGGVTILVDLFDPTKIALNEAWKLGLSRYALVFFNGHSIYGTRDLLLEPDTYAKTYQIIAMHSCRSYSYYARQVFRAKRTTEDERGWAMADVIATGESSYPDDSPPTLRILLTGLLDGMVAASAPATRAGAPTWAEIVLPMNARTEGILYGVSGVRTNRWAP